MQPILSLLTFRGRARRTSYGIFFAVTVAAYFAMSLPFSVWTLQRDKDKILEQVRRTNPDQAHIFDPILKIPHSYVVAGLIVSAVILLLLYIVWVALCVRRLHDIGLSGWLVLIPVLIAIVPILGYLLVSLILGLWPGSKGQNRYGPDPRDPTAVAEVFGRGPAASF